LTFDDRVLWNSQMYDTIIVGAGSAGCVLANRLSADPTHRVLLLEAGEPDNRNEIRVPVAFSKLFHTRFDWNYYTTPQAQLNGRTLYWPRGRTLGGSSSINAMIYIRGSASIYERWADATGDSRWAYQAVLPYFKRSERHNRGGDAFHGGDGPMHVQDQRDPRPTSLAFVEAATQVGIPANPDFNGATPEGAGLYQVNQRRGERHSAADAFLKPVLQRPNLTVQTGAHVERLAHNGERFCAVEVRQGDARVLIEAAREIILCGGAINTPQVLMLSGVGPGDHLQQMGIDVLVDVPGVGANLQDHLACGLMLHCRQPVSLADAETPGNLLKYLVGRVGPLTSNVAEAGAYVRSPLAAEVPDIQFHFGANFFINHGEDNPPGHGMSIGPVLVDPHSRGTIRLSHPKPSHPLQIDPAYLSDSAGHDMAVLVHGLRVAREIADAPAMRPFAGTEYLPGADVREDDGLREHIRSVSQTLYHPVGTCKMGHDDDPMAVVDSDLRLRGATGVRVVDASVMPVIPNGNTHAPTVMLAEVAADMILGKR
jgi:choline dehydrogenase